jgi:hypothetical protein
MVIKGKVLDIINVSDKVTQVVIMVKKEQIYYPICFAAYDNVKVIINQINLQKKDIVKIYYYVRSKKYENKYYTTAVLEKIIVTEKSSPQLIIDMFTGEIMN